LRQAVSESRGGVDWVFLLLDGRPGRPERTREMEAGIEVDGAGEQQQQASAGGEDA